jgi:hypothetical protein
VALNENTLPGEGQGVLSAKSWMPDAYAFGVAFALALVVLVVVVLAGFAVLVVDVFDVVVLDVVVFDTAGVEVLTGATLVVVLVFALFALTFTFADSPQAIPRALRPRTVESTSTFFILILRLLSILKDFACFHRHPADLTQPSALNSFFFRASVKIEIGEPFVNLNMPKNSGSGHFF